MLASAGARSKLFAALPLASAVAMEPRNSGIIPSDASGAEETYADDSRDSKQNCCLSTFPTNANLSS